MGSPGAAINSQSLAAVSEDGRGAAAEGSGGVAAEAGGVASCGRAASGEAGTPAGARRGPHAHVIVPKQMMSPSAAEVLPSGVTSVVHDSCDSSMVRVRPARAHMALVARRVTA